MKEKIKSGYLERNPLLRKTHKIRENLCCWCACPRACVSVGSPQTSLCLQSPTSRCTGEAYAGSAGAWTVLTSIACPPCTATLRTHRMASILRVLTSTELPCSAVCEGRIYLICLKLTNPPVLGNKTNLRRGKGSLF